MTFTPVEDQRVATRKPAYSTHAIIKEWGGGPGRRP